MESVPGKTRTLCPRQPVPFVIDAAGVVHWELNDGRQFLFDGGIVYMYRGNSFYPMFEVWSFEGAIIWSLGFQAGRDLPLVLREKLVK